MKDYARFISQLKYVLSNDGRVDVEGADGQATVAFTTRDGRRFDFRASLDEIYRLVELNDSEILSRAEDSSPLEAQLRLFSVHVWEAVETAADDARFFEVRDFGVVAV
ncbi:hypothetical protein [Arthrobacter cupressi]|uniref:Uncharacterized protein n=1 Tax=Arthrobacter cupressi TaxID=1045773 RepID=A0A1G8KGT3_9MICC|nr:hypothetical protein [Arthrobacter cupressi]NYD77221.1 hypothetical protein [Arthrobacter cupressi]SDI42602.1 hypothetical protein SAMN05216555_102246 [Arthrobacter cupressi]